MPERSIEELLALLPGPVEPDPGFEADLRARLAVELAGDHGGTAQAPSIEEVLELEATVERPTIRWSWRGPVMAAAVVAVIAAVAVAITRDDQTTTTAEAPDQTYVGASLTTIDIEVGTNPYFVGVGEDAWVLSLGGHLTRLDAATGEALGSVITVPESSPLAVDEHAVWVADAVRGDVLRLDLETGEVVERIETGVDVLPNTIRIPMLDGGGRQFSLIGGITSDSTAVWVGDRAGRVLRIDPDTNDIAGSIDVTVRPDHLSVDGTHLLVANLFGGEVTVVDANTGDEVLAVREFDELAGAVLYDGAAYLQDGTTGVVTRVDLESGDEVTSEPLGAAPDALSQPTLPTGLVVGAAGVLVVTDTAPNSVDVLDPVTLDTLGTLAAPVDRGDMTIGPDGTAWLVRHQERTVIRIQPVG